MEIQNKMKRWWQLYIGITIIGMVLIPDPSLSVQHLIRCSIYTLGGVRDG